MLTSEKPLCFFVQLGGYQTHIDLLPVPRELPLACPLVLRGGERARQVGLGLRLSVPDQVGVETVLGGDLADGLCALRRLEHQPRLELGGVGFALGHG